MLRSADGRVRLTVTDDGVGIPPEGRRSPLRTMEERAAHLGGSLDLSSPDGGGTRLDWSAPAGTDTGGTGAGRD